MIKDLDVMDVDVIEEWDNIHIIKLRGEKAHSLMDEDGNFLFYDEVPRRAQSLYDRIELKRQGQLELPLNS
jgi:hypothetical protein